LKIDSKTDKEDRSCDDIAFLSEIISDFRFWQEIVRWVSAKFGADLEHIINFQISDFSFLFAPRKPAFTRLGAISQNNLTQLPAK